MSLPPPDRPARYQRDVLSGPRRGAPTPPVTVAAEPGLLVTHRGTYAVGRVVTCSPAMVVLRLDDGAQRTFRLRPGAFMVDRRPATLVPARSAPPAPVTTASGSIAGPTRPARTARASRIWVEGLHDAELVEKVWGDDLRHEAIVVEPLGGADDLADAVAGFGPSPQRRLGVLLDHLVDGSKESRIAASVRDPHVLITGHPFVDVWQGVRPHVVGIDAWPQVPRGQPWKEGVCAALGVSQPTVFWRRLLGSVRTYADLEQPLVGAVERLIDFVTEA